MPANKPNFARLFLSLPIQGTFFSEQFFKHSEDHCNTSKKSSVSQKCLIFNMKRRELLKNTLIVVTIFTINNNNILSGFLPVDKEAVCYSGDRTIQ